MPLAAPPAPLLLTGFMGSGKTTLGRCLAAHLGWYFCDLDERIEVASGCTIPDIFVRRGEAGFRAMEREQLDLALGAAARRRTVLALGGGTFAQPAIAGGLLSCGGCVVFLDVPVEDLLVRCAQVTNRPLFRDEASFRELYERRRPFYLRAHVTLALGPGEAMNPPEVLADRLLEQVYQWAASQQPSAAPGPIVG
ncbi:MAG: shikimate kinase, partial [Terriglobales bacterium]